MPTNNGHSDGAGKKKLNLKLWLAGGLGVYLLLFVLANTDPVDVNFVLFQARDIGLIWVMVLVAAITFAIGWVTGRAGRRDKRDKKD
ncbi:MAG: LapA family protein [Actinobacteria bacterium]|nr:LapA family protein [Actinomycetota bacterium]